MFVSVFCGIWYAGMLGLGKLILDLTERGVRAGVTVGPAVTEWGREMDEATTGEESGARGEGGWGVGWGGEGWAE